MNVFYELDPIFQQIFEKVALGKILDVENQLALMREYKNSAQVLNMRHVLEDTPHCSGQDNVSCINIRRNVCISQRCSTVFEINAVCVKGKMLS